MTQKETIFLGSRLTQLREKNGVKSLQAMMDLLNNSGNDEYAVYNKSTLSRVESASVGEKTVVKWAKAYCDVLGYSEKQTELFLRGDKIAVPDTSALMKNPQLVEELGEEYNMVVMPFSAPYSWLFRYSPISTAIWIYEITQRRWDVGC